MDRHNALFITGFRVIRTYPQQRLVSFKITDAMQIENGRVLTEM